MYFKLCSYRTTAESGVQLSSLVFGFCSGAIGARLSTDAAAVKSMVGDTLSLIVQNVGTIVCGLTIAFTANWELSLLVLALVPLLGMQGFMQMKFMKGFSNDAKVPNLLNPLYHVYCFVCLALHAF